MGKEILKLKPSQLWKHFYDLSQIPPSYRTDERSN